MGRWRDGQRFGRPMVVGVRVRVGVDGFDFGHRDHG
jgi:hypothetical protein